MTTTRPACLFSSSNPSAVPSAPVLGGPESLPGLERLRAAVALLPVKTKTPSPWPGLSLGQRQTLMTLVGCLPAQDDGSFDSRQAITTSLQKLYRLTCYSKHATTCHIRALTRAGWLYAEAGWQAEQGTYLLSPAIELYAELLRVSEQATSLDDADEATKLQQQKDQITQTLEAELRHSQERTAAQKTKRQRRTGKEVDPLSAQKEKVFVMATAIAGRANAGLSVSYLLKDLIDACTPFVSTRDPKEDSATPPPPPPAPAAPPEKLTPEQQKKAVLLRNELFVISHRLDSKTLGPQISAFARNASLTELEKKLAALKQLARGKG